MNTPQKSPTVAVAIAELLAKMGARVTAVEFADAFFRMASEREARERLLIEVKENIAAFLQGRERNRVA